MESQSVFNFYRESSFNEVSDSDAEVVHVQSSRAALRHLPQSASQSAAGLLLLRHQQIALGDTITGECLRKCFADAEDEDDSTDEEDLSNLVQKRHVTIKDYSMRAHRLRPLRTESQKAFRARLAQRCPLTRLAKEQTTKGVISDLVAGATVTVMGVPESLSYAQIAGLPFEFGLYALVVPQLVYSFFGQSRQLMVGPVAMLSLLLHAGLEGSLDHLQCPAWYNQTRSDSDQQSKVCQEKYIDLAILQSLMCGVILLLCCVLQLGFLLKFLGHPVVSGFSTGSALVIMMSQLKNFLGLEVADSEYPILKIYGFAKHWAEWKFTPLGFGLLFTFALIALRKIGYKCNCKLLGTLGPLLSCVCGILLLYFCEPLRDGLDYIGDIPGGGLREASSIMSRWTWHDVQRSLPISSSVGLIGFLEAFATAQNLAKQHGYEVESDQELLALGLANIGGAFFASYPVSGSFSRSAVCNTSGGVSQLSGIVAALLSLLVLVYLTKIFFFLPKFVLAAIVVSSVVKLLAYDVAISLFRVKKSDFIMWMTAFLGTLCLGPLPGIGLAVLLSLAVVIYESVHPQIQVLWHIEHADDEGGGSYGSIQQNPNGKFLKGIFIVRIGASIYFANVAYVEDSLRTLIADMNAISEIKYLILDFTPVTTADFSSMEVLSDVIEHFREQGIQVAFACLGHRVEHALERFGLLESLGEWYFATVHEAVLHSIRHGGMEFQPYSFDQEMQQAVLDLKRAQARVKQLQLLRDEK